MLVKRAFQQVQFQPLIKTANREKRIIPLDNDTYRFLRFRAIGNLEVNGFNLNRDGFKYEDFEDDEQGYGYRSFIGKRAHWEHNSAKGFAGSIGDLPDAHLNRFIGVDKWSDLKGKENIEKRASLLSLPDQKDGAIEVLMRINTSLKKNASVEPKTKQFLERLVKMIDTGQKVYCSMGTSCQSSHCSICGNEARFASEYCNHLTRGNKGSLFIATANSFRDLLDKEILRPEWLPHIVVASRDIDEILKGSSNKGIAARSGEINNKLSFFELSVVYTPAFEQADALEKLASKGIDDNREYLRRIRAEVGDENLLNLYELMREDGVISSQCGIRG